MSHGIRQSARFEFPSMLYDMLEEVSNNSKLSKIVSWMPHGRAFKVHKPDDFEANVMPKYFRERYSSFRYLLEQWGFQGLRRGRDRGAYYNVNFVRGERDKIVDVTKQKMLAAMPEYLSPKDEPDFYKMSPPANKQPSRKKEVLVDDIHIVTQIESSHVKISTPIKAKQEPKKENLSESPKSELQCSASSNEAVACIGTTKVSEVDVEENNNADAVDSQTIRRPPRNPQTIQKSATPPRQKTRQRVASASPQKSSPKRPTQSIQPIESSRITEPAASTENDDSPILLIPSKPVFSGFGLPFKKLKLIVMNADELEGHEAFIVKRRCSTRKQKPLQT